MSIDIHEAIKAIKEMTTIIDPEDDYLTIVEAEKLSAISEAKRKKELEEAHANLKALSRLLESARASATRPATVPSAQAHSTAVNELDKSRLSLAKSISEAEGLVASREAELAFLREEARKLEDFDPAAEHGKQLDGTALRLQIYKGLGFEPVLDGQGTVIKMLVRAQSGDVHCVDFRDGKSDIEYTNLLWKLASS